MNSSNGNESIDAWTGMPVELDDMETLALSPSPAQAPPLSSFRTDSRRKVTWNFADLFWKLIAAGSDSTERTILASLATDSSERIRRRVAENANCPPEAFALLAEDESPVVRGAVAKNSEAPVHLLRKLACDESADVRYAIASNEEMPDAVLLSLFLDPDPYVAERASQTMAV